MRVKFLFFTLPLTFLFIIFCLNSISATTVYECRLINESGIYELNQSIEISGGVSQLCILINVSNVILDCINYSNSIVGNGSNDIIGVGAFDNIASQTLTNITVKNCNITKFDIGIWLNNTNDSIIFNNSAYNTTTGIDLEHTLDINISTNNITTFDSNSSAIFLMNDNSSVVENNIVTTNGILGNGITIGLSIDTLANLNTITISNTNASGIILEEYTNNTNVTTNTITTFDVGSMGIQVFDSSSSCLLFNNIITTSGNESFGIYLEGANDMNISSNNITTSGYHGDGIHFQASNNSMLTQNIVRTAHADACVINIEMSGNNNTLYDNIFNTSSNHPGTCLDDALANIWNTTEAEVTNIMGRPNLGGNFWTNNVSTGYSDTCIDSDGDYFCDTAYNLAGPGSEDTNNVDYLPLANHTNMVSACEILNVENKSYFLNQSVNVNGTCFNITANNITLNFNSSTITGNTTGYGVYINGVNATIVNGIISNFSNGLYLYNSSNDIISGLIINNSAQDAIFLNDPASENNNFTNITIINTNASYYDINFSVVGINGTWIIDTDFANYSFAGAGGLVNFKDSTYGIIKFLETINGSGTNLSNDVNIRSNLIFIDSSSNPGLNKSANISLYSITYTDPEPQYSSDASTWVNCTTATDPACSELSFSGNIFTFNTSHFTYFRAFETYSAPEEGNGDTGGRGGLGFPPEEEAEEPITYSEGENISGEAGGYPYNVIIDEITNNSVTLTIDTQTITLMIGESIEIDLNQDDISDLRITLFGIEEGKADLRFEEILPEEEEEEKVTPLWQKYLPHMIIGISIVLVISLIILAARKKHTSYKRKH